MLLSTDGLPRSSAARGSLGKIAEIFTDWEYIHNLRKAGQAGYEFSKVRGLCMALVVLDKVD